MYKFLLMIPPIAATLVLPHAALAQADDPKPIPAAKPTDVESIDAILAALYDVISGPAGQERDWDRFRSLFAPDARLIPIVSPQGKTAARVLNVEQFVEAASRATKEEGFFERQIAQKVERFGHIAHVWSTYESRHLKDDAKPFDRGINSFQLMNDGTRWYVITIYWDRESPAQPIPNEYLPQEDKTP